MIRFPDDHLGMQGCSHGQAAVTGDPGNGFPGGSLCLVLLWDFQLALELQDTVLVLWQAVGHSQRGSPKAGQEGTEQKCRWGEAGQPEETMAWKYSPR